jgi:anaerobic ribonucleoside-triphosphate reductase activating protein
MSLKNIGTKNMKIRIADIKYETTVDGPGFRTSIYSQGCLHHCKNCHNSQTWDFEDGKEYDVEELFDIIVNEQLSDVTFTGGDPMFQVEAFTELAKLIKIKTSKTIWCYSGYTYEEIKKSPKMSLILPFLDVLIDGPYIDELRDTDLKFRGSKNQRILYLKNGEIESIDTDN